MYALVLSAYLFLLLSHELVKIIVIAADLNVGQFADEIQIIIVEFAYMVIFLCLMLIFRPRKDWPEFYGIGLEAINNVVVMGQIENGARNNNNNDRARFPVCPILTFRIENKDVFDVDFDPQTAMALETNRNSGYEDDCMARRDSRLSLMSKQLLGLSDEEFDPNRLTQMAQQEREGGVSFLGTKDPILVINPSECTHENYLRDCQTQINERRMTILQGSFLPSAILDRADNREALMLDANRDRISSHSQVANVEKA